MYKLGIDIGGTKINIGITDGKNHLVDVTKIYISEISDIIESVKGALDDLCTKNSISKKDITSAGMGIPGTVSDDGKKILKAPNISILSDNIASDIENALKIPCTLIQDSRAAAWGEYVCGAAKGKKSVICITLGTGIGTGIVLNSKIYAGDNGSAGEIGHTPVIPDGRKCGCGKKGCLEKYAAGLGLDITASELLGEGKTAADLFDAAKNGCENSISAINNAITLLGNTLVSVINLMSPECMVFSGGLSNQEEMFLNPLMEYISSHAYTSGKTTELKKAGLGEYAPLIGAALCATDKSRKPMLSASVMCADILNLGKSIQEISDAGIDYVHCDIMDNHFVPNLMLAPELLNKMRKSSEIPFDYHIMAENPESIIEKLEVEKGDIISVHAESTIHLQKAITAIEQKGAIPAVALNPATPIEQISEVLPQIGMILVMTVNPGFAGQKLVPGSFEKIKRVRRYLADNNLNDIIIQVDGNCSFENVPKMYKAGADMFVVGTSSVFRKEHTIKEGTEKLLDLIR